jgi:ATP phosphoribosyltransferase regulatory subunit
MDFDGKLLALRPDVTSAVARAAVTLLAKRERPLRLWYVAPVFRQQGKSPAEFRRESTQIGCELFGRNSVTTDMEILAILSEILGNLNLDRDYIITLNDVQVFNGVADSLGLAPALRSEMRSVVDSRNRRDLERFLTPFAPAEDLRRFAELIQLSGKREVLQRARDIIRNERSRAALNRLDKLWAIIEALGLTSRFEIDLGDVSELEYYTDLSFKVYVRGAGVRVGSGGRYDNLTGKFGQAEPAIGFVLDLDALTDVWLARPDESIADQNVKTSPLKIDTGDARSAFQEALAARAKGRAVIVSEEPRS